MLCLESCLQELWLEFRLIWRLQANRVRSRMQARTSARPCALPYKKNVRSLHGIGATARKLHDLFYKVMLDSRCDFFGRCYVESRLFLPLIDAKYFLLLQQIVLELYKYIQRVQKSTMINLYNRSC
jgi:hypothetical protein